MIAGFARQVAPFVGISTRARVCPSAAALAGERQLANGICAAGDLTTTYMKRRPRQSAIVSVEVYSIIAIIRSLWRRVYELPPPGRNTPERPSSSLQY